MKRMISSRLSSIGASETLRISAKAKELAAQGIDVIDLSVGEPDFPTPGNVKAAGRCAIDQDITRYTPSPGLPDLRKAIAEKLERDNGVAYALEEIMVSSGAKQSLYNAFMAILNQGDEVIVPAPYWVSYPHQVALAGGKPVILEAAEEDGFRLTPGALKAAMTAKTKAVIINSPSNPTGAAYSGDELGALCSIAAEAGLVIVADEIYEKLVYDGFRFVSVASLGKQIRDHTIVINGVSKSHAMTGWRLGYAAGPREIIAAMNKVQSHSTSNASSISQMAAIEALRGPQTEVARMVKEFEKRRNYMVGAMRRFPGVSLVEPKGAFYVFPNFSSYYWKETPRGADVGKDPVAGGRASGPGAPRITDSATLAELLMDSAHIAVVPGSAFGNDRCIRLSYATSMDRLEAAVGRLGKALARS
jgi:aspartate/methionine/tyrosine aminotransferase